MHDFVVIVNSRCVFFYCLKIYLFGTPLHRQNVQMYLCPIGKGKQSSFDRFLLGFFPLKFFQKLLLLLADLKVITEHLPYCSQ